MKSKIIFVSFIIINALIFSALLAIPIRVNAFQPPIVQEKDNGITTQTNNVAVTITGVIAHDSLLFGASGALRSGADGAISVTGNNGLSCNTEVSNSEPTSGAVTMGYCDNVAGGSYTITATWTSNSCGSGSPCGFMAIYVVELQGNSFLTTSSAGNNAANSGTNIHTNSTSFVNGINLLFAVDSLTAVNTNQTAGAGFQFTGLCYTSGVNGATYACAEIANIAGSGSTNFNFTAVNSASWNDEGIIVECNNVVTSTNTAFNSTAFVTVTTLTDLSTDYIPLWVLFLIVAVMFASAIVVIRLIRTELKE